MSGNQHQNLNAAVRLFPLVSFSVTHQTGSVCRKHQKGEQTAFSVTSSRLETCNKETRLCDQRRTQEHRAQPLLTVFRIMGVFPWLLLSKFNRPSSRTMTSGSLQECHNKGIPLFSIEENNPTGVTMATRTECHACALDF